MKASITKDGLLKIQAETELEAYAFVKWFEDNAEWENDTMTYLSPDNLQFDFRTTEERNEF